MDVSGLALPRLLTVLIKEGKWSLAGRPLVDLGAARAHRLSPDDDQLVLMAPPFHTIADEVKDGHDWWNRFLTNVGEIDYSKAVIIADFGLGSDSVVILYYAHDQEPKVMYLKWSWEQDAVRHAWVLTHNSFDELAADLDLV